MSTKEGGRARRERRAAREGRTLGPTPIIEVGADGSRWNMDRFWAQVDKSPAHGGCWIWTGSRAGRGRTEYGQYAGKGGAHRAAYRIVVGAIPEGLELDHLCRVPLCVNPEHLEPVTRAENARRRFALITHCSNGHEFTPENTYTGWGQRACKTCAKARSAAQRARLRAERTVA